VLEHGKVKVQAAEAGSGNLGDKTPFAQTAAQMAHLLAHRFIMTDEDAPGKQAKVEQSEDGSEPKKEPEEPPNQSDAWPS
jgi:hypothetical protein